ncbi:porin [Chelativorans intermedius]|uniref:Porin n=1 Tax=Chelativorans intermedius TaxID=515947 RepID=A0ABV6D4L9_9HYPH|nr:porin [Chelativorans intermedius]MCT8998920.1 porin [Chelativorans intermedius]
MNIKSLLIGSAAATVAATGAQAADPIFVPEPEPMEYVRVCDVYGAGFFYIPGTETCLKIGGYVRYEIGARGDFDGLLDDGGWAKLARATLTVDARSETEYGTLGGFIEIRADSTGGTVTKFPNTDFPYNVNEGNALSQGIDSGARVQQAIISLGGLSMGLSDTLYDAGLSGEFDQGGGDRVHFIRYTYDAANGFFVSLALEEADEDYDYAPNVVGNIGVVQGWGSINVWGAYDATAEEWAAKAIAKVNATEQLWFEAIGTYESGINFYSVDPFGGLGTGLASLDPVDPRVGAEWSAGGLVGYQVNPRFKASIGAQYFSKVGHDVGTTLFGGDVNAIRAGATFDYEIVENFNTKLAVNYTKFDTPDGRDPDQWHGFLRFDRNF